MGRGRAKAKQQKVARELKYSSPNTDLSALERELHGSTQGRYDGSRFADAENDDNEVDEGDDDGWAPGRR